MRDAGNLHACVWACILHVDAVKVPNSSGSPACDRIPHAVIAVYRSLSLGEWLALHAGHWQCGLQAELGGGPHACALLDEPRSGAWLPEVHREWDCLWLRGKALACMHQASG